MRVRRHMFCLPRSQPLQRQDLLRGCLSGLRGTSRGGRDLRKMMNSKYLRAILGIALIVLAGAVALEAKNRQGEKDFKAGQAAEAKKDWDTAVALYQKASDED